VRALSSGRKLARCRSGVAAVEFAIVAMALFTFILVLIETGMQLLTQAVLDYGVREASRFGVTGAAYPPSLSANPPKSREDAITALILYYGGGFINQGRLAVTLTVYPSFSAVGQGGGTAGAGGPGAVVQYQATYTQPFLTSLAASIVGTPSLQHSSTTVVQNEPFPTN
jgi:Flp pilus assembly protein TadG